ncbi:hypothetical protein ACN9MJ_13040 [Acidovorax facilis]|uniref:hypothetical protein n=1 Tax=Acidovorax facilis TaxID=12917 RepID=UPI003CF6B8ED
MAKIGSALAAPTSAEMPRCSINPANKKAICINFVRGLAVGRITSQDWKSAALFVTRHDSYFDISFLMVA